VSAGATQRLARLLSMVPFLLQRQGIELDEAAAELGTTPAQLVRDLELLFVCGTPGHLPDDLIEADWETGRVYLDNADVISRPLRLGLDEALALLVGLRTLAEVPGVRDREALDSALAKLSAAAGDAAAAARAVSVELGDGAREDVVAAVRTALERRRRLHLRYLVPSRDETTERDVDPMRLLAVEGRLYLEAWCHRVEAVRLFRLDRVLAARVLDGVDGTPPPEAVSRDLDAGLFTPAPTDVVVVLELAAGARWVAEYYPTEEVRELADGGLRVSLRTSQVSWLLRLLLQLGGAARVVEPPDVARAAADAARDALAAYGT
jgi:predicted DNA-binding transcriptional regulator YafY